MYPCLYLHHGHFDDNVLKTCTSRHLLALFAAAQRVRRECSAPRHGEATQSSKQHLESNAPSQTKNGGDYLLRVAERNEIYILAPTVDCITSTVAGEQW